MSIDLSQFEAGKTYDGTYEKDLKRLQERLSKLQALHILHDARTLIIFEGWDVAGKGGGVVEKATSQKQIAGGADRCGCFAFAHQGAVSRVKVDAMRVNRAFA